MMIFFIAMLAGFIVGFVLEWREWGGYSGDCVLRGLIGVLLGLLAAFVIWIGCMFLPGADAVVVETHTTDIYALSDNSHLEGQTSGSIFLVQGRVNEQLKYRYMYNEPDKGYGFNEVNASSSYINYTDGTPHIEHRVIGCKSAVFRWLFFDIWEDEYIIYLPHDAKVIDDYVIDFE